MQIAVLLTTYNRKQKTLTCLEHLFSQKLPADVHISVYQTDDASTDGTADAVHKQFPQVHLLKGTGNFFWAGGMRYTWKEALKNSYDFYLLLNDDTTLSENAISLLLKGYNENKKFPQKAICVGSTNNPESGLLSYGGNLLTDNKLWKSKTVFDKSDYISCDFANANILLVPRAVVEKIGILSDVYTHSLADFDYTLKAKKAGFGIILIPGFLGTCIDDHGNNWKSQNTTLSDRIKYLKSPKGLAYDEYMYFIKEHFPASKTSEFIKIWLKTFFPFIWDKFKPAKVAG